MSATMDLGTDRIDHVPDFEIAPSLRRDCDRPLDPLLGFGAPEAVEVLFGLSPIPLYAMCQMRATLIANLMVASAASGEKWVFYSRDRSHYSLAATRRYAPAGYTYQSMLAAVADLEATGHIEHDRTAPSSFAKFRSRLRATPDFALRLRQLSAADLRRTPHELLILRNDRKSRMHYAETRHIARMRRDVQTHNALLANRAIALEHPDCAPTPQGWIIVDGRTINPAVRCYYRVFNGDFMHGGRWYGPWWQAIPRRYRQAITIDGVATVELDIKTCHPRLLCASAGLELPFPNSDFDFYFVPGEDRATIKMAVNIMLNARTPKKALLALANELRDRGDDDPSDRARQLMDTVVRQWPQLSRFWSSGVGLRLQNFDADICARVQRALRRADIPCLSVHDSFIVATKFRTALADAMEAEMARACTQLKRDGL